MGVRRTVADAEQRALERDRNAPVGRLAVEPGQEGQVRQCNANPERACERRRSSQTRVLNCSQSAAETRTNKTPRIRFHQFRFAAGIATPLPAVIALSASATPQCPASLKGAIRRGQALDLGEAASRTMGALLPQRALKVDRRHVQL